MTPRVRVILSAAVLVGAFVAVWTLIAVLAQGGGALHHDVVEAYVWGREFQLGYYKHPPFWAWLAGVWFEVFPRANWSADLLAMVNAAIGLVGAWRLAGAFTDGPRRSAAVLLLLATPFYTVMAIRFNANAIFLSLWPWTLWAFVRALDRGRAREAILFGALVGAAGLSKYYAVVLAAGCLLSLPLHPRGWAWLRSPGPWISAAVAAVIVAPHLAWLAADGFGPFHYFAAETGRSTAFILANVARMPLEWLGYQLAPFAVAALAAGTGPRAWAAELKTASAEPRFRLAASLLLVPLALTLVFGLVFRLKLSSNWTEAAFPLAPVLMLRIVGGDARRIVRAAGAVAAVLTAAALALAPAMGEGRLGGEGARRAEPRRELAAQAEALWRRTTGAPLRFVAGGVPYAEALAFYAQDRPSTWIDFDRREAPWIDPAALARDGWLGVCPLAHAACRARAEALAGPAGRRFIVSVRPQGLARPAPPAGFELVVAPPAARPAAG